MWSIITRFLVVLAIGACLQTALAEEAPLAIKLSFSTDGGKSYHEQPQASDNLGVLKVRASFSDTRPPGEREPYMSVIYCKSTDFASAFAGKQNWKGGPAWYQRPEPPYLAHSANPLQFDYDLDLGARPAGKMGKANVWDNTQQKQVDGPLPACPPISGKHTFVIRVYYPQTQVKPAQQIEGSAQFTLEIGSAPTTQSAGK